MFNTALLPMIAASKSQATYCRCTFVQLKPPFVSSPPPKMQSVQRIVPPRLKQWRLRGLKIFNSQQN